MPLHMQPEIFNVCASEGVSSVWEEPVEYRVDTPFSVTRRDQQALPFNLNGLTPPPTPRRGLPYLQYMGQITPTRRQHQMQTPQSTDLDITPVATPLKVHMCYVLKESVFAPNSQLKVVHLNYIRTYMLQVTSLTGTSSDSGVNLLQTMYHVLRLSLHVLPQDVSYFRSLLYYVIYGTGRIAKPNTLCVTILQYLYNCCCRNAYCSLLNNVRTSFFRCLILAFCII